MGSLPADSEQFMLIEHLASELEKLQTDIEGGKAPYDQQQKLTLEFYEKRITNLEENIEKLKTEMVELTFVLLLVWEGKSRIYTISISI